MTRLLHKEGGASAPLPRWAGWSLYWGFWTILGIVNAASAVIEMGRYLPQLGSWQPVLWEMSSIYTLGMLYPAVARAAARFPITRQNWFRHGALHCAFIVPFSALHTSGMVAIRKSVYWLLDVPYRFGGDNLARQVVYEFYKDISTYWILVVAALAFDYYRKYRDREVRAAQLQGQLAAAQLQNLRGQLNPHFLFNTLNMISSRMYDDPADADRMIARLSDLLRFSLKSSEETEVVLRTEVEMLELYLDIMRARFADSVRVNLEVDHDAWNVMVPTLLLQPLVENAFRHGVAGKPQDGCIEIRAGAKNGTLTLTVRDNGPGIAGSPDAAMTRGLGLANTAERLRQMYGANHSMSLRNRTGGGLEVVIEIPSRPGR